MNSPQISEADKIELLVMTQLGVYYQKEYV